MTSADVRALASLLQHDGLGVLQDALHVRLGLGERWNAAVLADRPVTGVIGSQGVRQSVSRNGLDEPAIDAVQGRRGWNGVTRVPDVADSVAVAIEAVLPPGGWHELGNALGAGRTYGGGVPATFCRDLRGEDL